MCVRAVDRLMTLQGAYGNSEKSPMQRFRRDMQTVSSHIALAWDAQGANYGRVALALPSRDPKI